MKGYIQIEVSGDSITVESKLEDISFEGKLGALQAIFSALEIPLHDAPIYSILAATENRKLTKIDLSGMLGHG